MAKFEGWAQFKKAWVKALRSGDYVQGTGCLVSEHNGVDHFCCLGVAANLLIKAGHTGEWFKDESDWLFGTPHGKASDGMLAGETPIPKWLENKLREADLQGRLIRRNDDGETFTSIATFIEQL